MKQTEEKKRYKQFKKGKFWVTAPVTFLVIGGTLAPSIGGIAQTLESAANTKPNVAVSTSSTSSSSKVQASSSSLVSATVQATSEVKVETKVQESSTTSVSEKEVSTTEESKLVESTSEVSTTEAPNSEIPVDQVSTTESPKTSETTKEVSTSEAPKSEEKKEAKEVKEPSTTTQDKKEVSKEEVEPAKVLPEKIDLEKIATDKYINYVILDGNSKILIAPDSENKNNGMYQVGVVPTEGNGSVFDDIVSYFGAGFYLPGDRFSFYQRNNNGKWEYKQINTVGENNAKTIYTPDLKQDQPYKEIYPGVKYKIRYTNIKSEVSPEKNTYQISIDGDNVVDGRYNSVSAVQALPGDEIIFHYFDQKGNIQTGYLVIGEEPKVDPVPEPSTSEPTAPTSSSTSEPTAPTSSSTSEPTAPTSSSTSEPIAPTSTSKSSEKPVEKEFDVEYIFKNSGKIYKKEKTNIPADGKFPLKDIGIIIGNDTYGYESAEFKDGKWIVYLTKSVPRPDTSSTTSGPTTPTSSRPTTKPSTKPSTKPTISTKTSSKAAITNSKNSNNKKTLPKTGESTNLLLITFGLLMTALSIMSFGLIKKNK